MSSSTKPTFSILEYDKKFQEKRKLEINKLIKIGYYTHKVKKFKYNQPFQYELNRQENIKN